MLRPPTSSTRTDTLFPSTTLLRSIVDHMKFLMEAAHDTITSSVTTLGWQLARHPEWQDKLREEMLSGAPAGEGVGHNSLGQLEMTEWAFKEALRLVPP